MEGWGVWVVGRVEGWGGCWGVEGWGVQEREVLNSCTSQHCVCYKPESWWRRRRLRGCGGCAIYGESEDCIEPTHDKQV